MRTRKLGAGRPKKEVEAPEILSKIDDLLTVDVAGDPMKPTVKWTHLSVSEIKEQLGRKGTKASGGVIKRILRQMGLGRRKQYKNLTMKQVEGRNAQFEYIGRLRKTYLSRGWPVISIDSKKKEQMGRFYREGEVFCTKRIEVEDHDFASFSNGKLIPYGIYDVGLNKGYVTLNQSADTAQLCGWSLRNWWKSFGEKHYLSNEPILILCDGGGSNGSNNHLFKDELDKFAKEINRNIRVAHYPPYCSKYNPIEHRLFPSITFAWRGTILNSINDAKNLLRERLKNLKSGLTVIIRECKKTFQKGIKIDEESQKSWSLKRDKVNEKWNYRFCP